MGIYTDKYTQRQRETKVSKCGHFYIREIISDRPQSWKRVSKTELNFILQHTLLNTF